MPGHRRALISGVQCCRILGAVARLRGGPNQHVAPAVEGRDRQSVSRHADSTIANVHVPWEGETGGPVILRDDAGAPLELAFDHAGIVGMAVQRIRGKLNYAPIGFELLPERFTLLDLQRIHEAVLGRRLNKDSFRRKMLASGLVEDTHQRQTGTSYRPAALYRFNKQEASTHG